MTVSPDSATWDKNLFAYCDNNPVSRKDDGGAIWHVVIGAAVGGLVSGGMNLLSCYFSGEAVDWGQFAIDVAFGAISGAFVGINNPLVDGVVSLANSVVNEAYVQYQTDFQDFTWGTFSQNVITSTAADLIVGDIVSNKADDALTFITVPRDTATQSAANYSAKAAAREKAGRSASYYSTRASRQSGISQTLTNWYCGLKSGISSFFSGLF